MTEPRRFPPPWKVVQEGESFSVEHAKGRKLAYVYFEDGPSRRSNMKCLTSGEARRIAVNIAKLPDLLRAK